jgi:hypothetical protein
MPYEIKKYKSGWRVYSEDGTPLSNKPLSLKRAKAQRTAVNIAEFAKKPRRNLKGGAIGDVLSPLQQILAQQLNTPINSIEQLNQAIGLVGVNNVLQWLLNNFDTDDILIDMEGMVAHFDPQTIPNLFTIWGEVMNMEEGEVDIEDAETEAGSETESIRSKIEGEGKPMMKFKKQLMDIGLNPEDYLKTVQAIAKKRGYKTMPQWSDNNKHKLMIKTPEGNIRRFGAVGYGDYLIWSWLENEGKVPKGTAKQKRNVFNKSHTKIKGDWKNDKYSPNSLALNILW